VINFVLADTPVGFSIGRDLIMTPFYKRGNANNIVRIATGVHPDFGTAILSQPII